MTNQPELKVWLVATGNFEPIKQDIKKIKSQKEIFRIRAKSFLSSGIKAEIVDEIGGQEWLEHYEQGIPITLFVEGSGLFSIANISPKAKFLYLKSLKPSEKLNYDYKRAFIIMSMTNGNKDLDDIKDSIEEAIKTASKELNLPEIQCMRVDDKKGETFKIDDIIFSNIEQSGIIICDLTEEKPNCYFELAWAMAHKRKIIITAKKDTKIHFDVSRWNIRFWESNRELKNIVKSDVFSIINEIYLNKN